MNTPRPGDTDALTAALLQITAHAERLALIDEREASHYQQITAHLAELARLSTGTSERLTSIQETAARHAAILECLDGLDTEVAALTARIAALADNQADGAADKDPDAYQPGPAPRWWKLTGTERDEALARLRAWVGQVYRPGYGHLAASLGPCWEQHPLCLYGLDWLMELWSVLYLTGQRKAPLLASQAEWQTRLLPALAEQMYLETTRCHHGKGPPPRQTAASTQVAVEPTRSASRARTGEQSTDQG